MEEPTSQLYDLDPVDAIDGLELELIHCHQRFKELVAGKSDLEVHQALQDHASQNMKHHADLVNGLLYTILSEPDQAGPCFRYLNVVTRDGYALVLTNLRHFSCSLKFALMRPLARTQLFWLINQLIQLNIGGIDGVCLALMRQLRGGDVSPANLKSIDSILHLFQANQRWVYSHPFVVSTAFYTFSRLLLDHFKCPTLREKEVEYCAQLLRDKFLECCHIGRDFVRALQNVSRIPAFKRVWSDIIHQPESLSPHFKGLTQLLSTPTPKMYLQSRLTFDMETKLLFILERLKWSDHQRNLTWFIQRYLSTPESESLHCDVIRYICGVYHPSNAILASDIVPRYVVLGTLLRTIRSPVVASNVKLALLYDWLFYDPAVDSIMSIEPAILLMERSLEKYPYFTTILMEFLDFTIREYHPPLRQFLGKRVHGAMQDILAKSVIRSLEVLTSCPTLDKAVVKKINRLFNTTTTPVLGPDDTTIMSPSHADPLLPPVEPLEEGASSTFNDVDFSNDALAPSSLVPPDPTALPTVNFDRPPEAWTQGSPPPTTAEISNEVAPMPEQPMGSDTPMSIDEVALSSSTDPGLDPSLDLGSLSEPDPAEDDDISAELVAAAKDPALWIFGENFEQLQNALDQHTPEAATSHLAEILHIFRDCHAMPNLVAAALALALRHGEPAMLDELFPIELGANMLIFSNLRHTTEATTLFLLQDPDQPPDALYSICEALWRELTCPTLESEAGNRWRALLALLCKHVPGLDCRWLVFCLHRACSNKALDANVAPNPVDIRAGMGAYCQSVTVNTHDSLARRLVTDMQSLQDASIVLFYHCMPLIYMVFAKECVGNTDLLRILVTTIDQNQVYQIREQVLLGGMQVFGQAHIGSAVVETLDWETFDQICIWQLVNTEMSGRSEVIAEITEAVLPAIDPEYNSEALNGLLNLLRTVAPTKPLLTALASHARSKLDTFALCALLLWSRVWPEQLVTAWGALHETLHLASRAIVERCVTLFSAWQRTRPVDQLPSSVHDQLDKLLEAFNQLSPSTPLPTDAPMSPPWNESGALDDEIPVNPALTDIADNPAIPKAVVPGLKRVQMSPLVGTAKRKKPVIMESDSE
ncbi:hypothetical protein H4R34_002870 [Dimargaris verticillata]|uniref:Integrator complex subunit 3 n=1 Tax=Dimargaris verticillata TaxID=2761393 RepID=A0A9W8EDP3_9FUNG|nr:hypothetical protein H4R34_002870 [Dimargaris verticillata]